MPKIRDQHTKIYSLLHIRMCGIGQRETHRSTRQMKPETHPTYATNGVLTEARRPFNGERVIRSINGARTTDIQKLERKQNKTNHFCPYVERPQE